MKLPPHRLQRKQSRGLPCVASTVVVVSWALAGCAKQGPPIVPAGPPSVNVSKPVQREVTDFVDYTGRTDAVFSVDIRPRVTGYLVSMPFKEGTEVKKGELLFEIDPRPYQALYDQAESQVKLNEAQLNLAIANLARAKNIAKTPGAISQQDIDTAAATEAQAKASVAAAKANVETQTLNLGFTRVLSPIDGMVSRYYLTLGNLVNQDSTLLTTVMSLDPMYVYFDMDELTILNIRKKIMEGKILHVQDRSQIPLFMGLQNEQGFPHLGALSFVNNRVDPSTGTITVRGRFDNPKSPTGIRLLTPGLFVRIRLRIGQPHPALLVADQCVGTDQALKFLYVVDANKKVVSHPVTLGALQEDGLRVVETGLKADDLVVVNELQLIQAGMVVAPIEVPMASPFGTSTTQPTMTTSPPGTTEAPTRHSAPQCCSARRQTTGDNRTTDRQQPTGGERKNQVALLVSPQGRCSWRHDFLLLHRSADLRLRALDCDCAGRRHRDVFAADHAVSDHRAANGPGLDQLSGSQRADRGRHGRRSDRAEGQRHSKHAVHVVAIEQRRLLYLDRDVRPRD